MKKNRMTLVRAFGFSLAMIGLCGFVYPLILTCLLYTSPSPRDRQKSRMPSSA